MWVVKWNQSTTGQRDYLREMFREGKVLQFEWEEDALRFLEILKSNSGERVKPISYHVARYSGDRKEKYKLVKSSMIERAAEGAVIGIA